MRISDWSSDVCSSDLPVRRVGFAAVQLAGARGRAQPDRRELQDRRPGIRQHGQHPDRVLRPAAQLVRVAALQLLLSSMDAWDRRRASARLLFLALVYPWEEIGRAHV